MEVLPRSCPCPEPSCPLFWSWPWRWGGAGLEVRTSRLRGPGVSASRGGRAWLSLQKVQPWAEGGYLSHLEAPLNLGAWGQHLLNFRCHPDKCCPSHAQGTRTPASASRTPPARSLDASEGPGIRQALRVQQGQREGTGSCAQGSHRVWGHSGKGAATPRCTPHGCDGLGELVKRGAGKAVWAEAPRGPGAWHSAVSLSSFPAGAR